VTLTLYNTLTRKKEPFRPIDPANIRMYVCGPTVYDFAHIGNARPVIVFDVLFRLLRHLAKQGVWDGGKGETRVTYARNITDVDDKINARAAEEYPGLPLNEAIRKVTEKTEKQFHEDIAALGVLQPTVEPRATEHIAEMRALCEALVAKGHAYVAQDHVLFDVSSMPDYGRLANRSLEEMEAGARVDVAPYKKGPMDFVLWKPSKPGEPAWPSPVGINAAGRPGWHIECSAMADRWLWQEPQVKGLLSEAGMKQPHVFDIHGGGIDLVFPHHENEIAQSRCGHGTSAMAKVWMHNGFLQVEGEKMSKSLGNFVTIRELLATDKFGGQRWPGEVLRLAMLMTHYREPINWSIARLKEARQELWNWIENYRRAVSDDFFAMLHVREQWGPPDNEVIAALQDDLNTPKMLTRLRQLNKEVESGSERAAKSLVHSLLWLGLYRNAYHDAYGDELPSASGTEASGGRAPPIYLISKYSQSYLEAKTIVLNEYRWNTPSANEREKSRSAVEAKINSVWPEMRDDGVAFRLGEHCNIDLVPLDLKRFGDQDKVKELIGARNAARKARDFKEADRIRDELTAMGIQLKDAKDPATGEIVTTWEVRASSTTEVKR
jgi:cysteinyl-tRNA synthetase